MRRVRDFWDSGKTGKATIIGTAVLAIGCCLCVVLSAAGVGLSQIIPAMFSPGMPTVTATVTSTGQAADGSAEPDLTETQTAAPTTTGTLDLTTTATSTMTPTATTFLAAPPASATRQPTAVPTAQPPAPTQAPPATSTPKPPPVPTATPALVGYTITFLTSPIIAGQKVTLTIKTAPNSACNLSYVTPQGVTSNIAGLGATTADAKGVCSWTWRITPNTNPGTGKLFITAGGVTGEKDIVIQ